MTKMDEFVEAMEKAFKLSKELNGDGINSVKFDITYYGTPAATREISFRVCTAMQNAGFASANTEVA